MHRSPERTDRINVVNPVPSAPLSPAISCSRDIETVTPIATVVEEEETWYDWRNVSPGGKQVVGNDTRSLQHSPRAMQGKRLQEDKQDIAYASWMLLILMLCLFTWECAQGDWQIEDPKINPMFGPPAQILVDSGARRGDLVIVHHEWWRLFSSTFIHAGLIHCFISIVLLVTLARSMEKKYGWLKVSFIFLFGATFGAVIGMIFVPTGLALGATAGLVTLYGAELGGILIHGHYEEKVLVRSASIILIIGFILSLGIMPLIDNWATAAGVLIGVPLGIALLERPPTMMRRKHGKWYRFICIMAASVALGLFIIGFIVLYTSITEPWCGSACSNFTCVEIPKGSQNPLWYCDMCHLYGFEYTFRASEESGYITCPDGSVVDFMDSYIDLSFHITQTMLDMCLSECVNLNFGFGRREGEPMIPTPY